jgi:acyl-CoA synthetase (AMP-forming)/AMP-acid ligase II
MTDRVYQPGEAYEYPLLIKKLLATPIMYAPEQEIVYRDKMRYTYRTFYERINRFASSLETLGIKRGDAICVFDFDSHRYLESYFAIPMMGAVMHTMNWRLSPDQILYTMNHAEDDAVMINEEFLPLLEIIWDRLTTAKKVIFLTDEGGIPETQVPIDILPLRAHYHPHAGDEPSGNAGGSLAMESHYRRLRSPQRPRQGGHGAGYRNLFRIRHVGNLSRHDYRQLKGRMKDWDDDRKIDTLTRTGLPIPLVELKLEDPAGNVLPHDGESTGELLMRSPWLTKSYYNDPEKTKDLCWEGWMASWR